MKKVWSQTELQFDFDDPTVDENGQKVSLDVSRPSYKSTLMGASSDNKHDGFAKEEFTLLEGDAVTEFIDGVPSLIFSDRVMDFIKWWMARKVVVKLLGGRIEFNVLLNKISFIWSP